METGLSPAKMNNFVFLSVLKTLIVPIRTGGQITKCNNQHGQVSFVPFPESHASRATEPTGSHNQ